MNKLYTIKFILSNGYVISVYNTFYPGDLIRKIANNPEWTFTLIESNDIHDIYIAE